MFLFVVAVIAWRATRRPPPAAPTPAALPVVIAPLAGSAPSPLPEHLLPRLATGAAAGAAQQPDTAAATFEGRVVSSATGARIPGADLTFSRGGGAASVYAGADGAFRFDAPTEGRWLLAAVMAPGFLPFAPEWGHSPVELDARAGRHVTGIEIHLAPATTVIGRVLDRSGNPIAGATARLLGAATETALAPIADRFTTDASGEFLFTAPEGTVIEARSEGFVPGRAKVDSLALLGGSLTVTLVAARQRLGGGGTVTGRVVASGTAAPLVGVLVVAEPERRLGGVDVPSAQALTDAEGRFSLTELDPGAYSVTGSAAGRAPASVPHVKPGATDVLLELADGGRLRGCVSDASTGAPVALFTVLVRARQSAARDIPERSRSVIDPSGCYALDDLSPGEATVMVFALGYGPSPELSIEVPPLGGEAVADAVLEAGGRLEGVVLDKDTHAPISDARVSVEGLVTRESSAFPVLSTRATTGDDGGFTLAYLPHRVRIKVAARHHHPRIIAVDVPASGTASVEVLLRPGGDERRTRDAPRRHAPRHRAADGGDR